MGLYATNRRVANVEAELFRVFSCNVAHPHRGSKGVNVSDVQLEVIVSSIIYGTSFNGEHGSFVSWNRDGGQCGAERCATSGGVGSRPAETVATMELVRVW